MSQAAISPARSSGVFLGVGGPVSPSSYDSSPLLDFSSQLPNGAESHHDRDRLKVTRPTIQTEFPNAIIHSPSDPSSNSSGLPSSIPPTTPDSTPYLYTCPALSGHKPLPFVPDGYGLSPQHIDPNLLHASGETDRGRQLRSGPRHRSLSQSFAGNAPSGPSGRSAYVQRSQPLLPADLDLELPLHGFPASEHDDETSILFDSVPINVVSPEDIFGPLSLPDIAFSDILESGDEDASIYHSEDDNEGNAGTAEEPSASAFRPVVASEEVLVASRSRRTTKTPRYTCSIEGCKADFTAKHNLKNHLNAHNGVKKYVCEFCQHKYTTSHVLNRHKKTCKQAKKQKYNQ
ncbi:hypothetical protein L218DRAFT_622952 [Marasmius fiardii PR-910]|nr:hypothetical protein L218DRAFT_622952 [Marasmius fiardii PR-910]